jgi:hypothetical protein
VLGLGYNVEAFNEKSSKANTGKVLSKTTTLFAPPW